MDGAEWVTPLFAILVVKVAAHVAGSQIVVGDDSGGVNARATKEVSAEGTGFDDGDVYTERGELLGEGFGESFDRRIWRRYKSPCLGWKRDRRWKRD